MQGFVSDSRKQNHRCAGFWRSLVVDNPTYHIEVRARRLHLWSLGSCEQDYDEHDDDDSSDGPQRSWLVVEL